MTVASSFCTACGQALVAGSRYCGNCGVPVASSAENSLWSRFRGNPTWVQVLAWVFGYWLLVQIWIWSGTTWPWYAKLALSLPLVLLVVPFMFA